MPVPVVLVVTTLTVLAACPRPSLLSDQAVESADGGMKAHLPAEAGWRCAPNDIIKDTYRHSGVKCVNDDAGVVLNAKLYEVDTPNARTAEVFCIQDWKEAMKGIFRTVVSSTTEVRPFRDVPACHVAVEGTSEKGPWRVEEIHAPNGRKLLQVSVNGSLPGIRAHRAVIDAWMQDLRYDLKVAGQR
jgi:hypothetical protein